MRFSPEPRSGPPALRVYTLTVLALVLISLLNAWLRSRHGGLLQGFGVLYLSDPAADFYAYVPRFEHRHSPVFYTLGGYLWYYPAPAIILHWPFYKYAAYHGCPWPKEGYALNACAPIVRAYYAYLAVVLALWTALAVALARKLRRDGLSGARAASFAAAVVFLNWPLYFAAERGNVEALNAFLVITAIWALLSQRRHTCAVILGIAGSIKLYPLLLAAVFLRKKQIRFFGETLLVAALVTLLCLHHLDPHLRESFNFMWSGVQQWTVDYADSFHTSTYDHSLFNVLKLLTISHPDRFHNEKSAYLITAALLAGVWWLLRIRRAPLTNQIVWLACAAVILPPASFDYTLCLLFLPVALLSHQAVLCARAGRYRTAILPALLLLALCNAPVTFVYIAGYNVAGPIKALSILALATLASAATFEADDAQNEQLSRDEIAVPA